MQGTAEVEKQRIDKWLFHARVTKSRSLAAKLVQAGGVRCNGNKVRSPSQMVRKGDVLTIAFATRILIYKIIDFAQQRGSATIAQTLYENLTPEPKKDEQGQLPVASRDQGSGRPTKRQRRQIDALRDL